MRVRNPRIYSKLPFWGYQHCDNCGAVPYVAEWERPHTMKCNIQYRLWAVLDEARFGEPDDILDKFLLAFQRERGAELA